MTEIIKVNMMEDMESQGVSAITKFLDDKKFTLINPRFKRLETKSSEKHQRLYIDDVSVARFIVCLSDEGEKIGMPDNTYVQLKYGEGCVLIGAEGHAFLGLEPTLHYCPQKNKIHFSVYLDDVFNIHSFVSGEGVAEYEGELYKRRRAFVEDINKIVHSRKIGSFRIEETGDVDENGDEIYVIKK
jgi:hypothetical protein